MQIFSTPVIEHVFNSGLPGRYVKDSKGRRFYPVNDSPDALNLCISEREVSWHDLHLHSALFSDQMPFVLKSEYSDLFPGESHFTMTYTSEQRDRVLAFFEKLEKRIEEEKTQTKMTIAAASLLKKRTHMLEDSIKVTINGKPAVVSLDNLHMGAVHCPHCNTFVHDPGSDFDKIKSALESMNSEFFESQDRLHCKKCNEMYNYTVKIRELSQ